MGSPREYFLRFLRFLRNDLSVITSDWGRWLDRVKDAHAQSKSSSRLPSLCSTQPHIDGLFDKPYYYGEGNLCAGGSCKSSPQAENRVHVQSANAAAQEA
jgi:hypothetical protein